MIRKAHQTTQDSQRFDFRNLMGVERMTLERTSIIRDQTYALAIDKTGLLADVTAGSSEQRQE